jgi:hypothetical protein
VNRAHIDAVPISSETTDNNGQQLAYVRFDDPRSAAKPLTRDEARRIASNIAKLLEPLRRLLFPYVNKT